MQMYDNRLKELNPGVTGFTYSMSDLCDYLDKMAEICVVV